MVLLLKLWINGENAGGRDRIIRQGHVYKMNKNGNEEKCKLVLTATALYYQVIYYARYNKIPLTGLLATLVTQFY